jgi:ABC-type glutathione transport system ATPase component
MRHWPPPNPQGSQDPNTPHRQHEPLRSGAAVKRIGKGEAACGHGDLRPWLNENCNHLKSPSCFFKLSQLQVRYAGQQPAAVRDVSFGMRAGDIGVLIGPSGCGKTTLLRAVAGLEPVSGGCDQTRWSHREQRHAQHVPAEKRRIGMVFQDYALFPHLMWAQRRLWHPRLAKAEQRCACAEVLELGGPGRPGRGFRMSCLAASSNASRWRAHWRPNSPNCCCWTNPFPIWMWTCASAWRMRCAAF